MPGIDDVARLAGVSTATVSRALSGNGPVSDHTRARVVQAASELGYVVSSDASSLASGRTRNIGAVVPHLNRWFFTSVIEGAERVLLGQGYDLTLYNLSGDGGERRRVFDHHLLRNRVDAVFTVSLELAEGEVSRLLALGKPVVGVGGPLPGVSTLTIDDLAVARLATDHLISLGHIRIAHIGGSQEFDLDFHIPTSRRLGYEQALRDAGLPVDEQLHRASDFTLPGGYDAAKQLLGSPHERPTAIFAGSDEMAIGAILAARDLGLSVPRDVSIIGIDDHPLADFFGLSTVAQHPDRQGEQAAALLLDALQAARAAPTRARPDPLSHTAPADLIVRSSTAVHP
ncbi:DNA-binding transcriptional regulator, LacI/PurR family [Leifsonia sp. 98AMF]|uniref:LacI family DNA-binding transcriptional regulator n=1 Tax=unclassified Leifsonia TaxID=2663824 RepID=UPI0008795A01|nr:MULTISPECIES: LacI family DNA-binding transcriptional regulator [unclassified Leifsonia]SDH06553.1 DNA-binding transcriptional regulator, LacI/PurR family [Leifsonia sp. 197AMF]SDJ33754.1 DNA-binding transcriptional regulator, LacI/PurR family [Leifsonia sp. 466MF]SDK46181.1 DNA-binding transcriptional regulator, LacI/PurR family [Leifsonia sp. 157MF]SDN54617.1 DNA-binding transcriptional regulator, LacI/PurR family [Leifsonia sp. 509MF]SEN55314.1 DNA-binding transcriptional regulator, LacI